MPYALCTQVFPIYCGREARHLRPADAGPGPKELLLSRHNPFVPSLSEWLPPPPPLPRFSACSFLSPSLCHRPYPSPPHPPRWPSFSFAPPASVSPSITLCVSVSVPCSPASPGLLVPRPASAPFNPTAVSLCRSGGPGAGGGWGGSPLPPSIPHPAGTLGLWETSKRRKKTTQRRVFWLFVFKGGISQKCSLFNILGLLFL